MRTFAFILASVCISLNLMGKVAPGKYFISFTDKNNSPYTVDRPQEFLSERAIERRTRQGIGIVQNDIPVNSAYINAVKNLGDTVLTVSK